MNKMDVNGTNNSLVYKAMQRTIGRKRQLNLNRSNNNSMNGLRTIKNMPPKTHGHPRGQWIPGQIHQNILTEQEEQLIKSFRLLTHDGKLKAIEYINYFQLLTALNGFNDFQPPVGNPGPLQWVPQQGGPQQWVPQLGGPQQWVLQPGGLQPWAPQQGGTQPWVLPQGGRPQLWVPQQGGSQSWVPQQGGTQQWVPQQGGSQQWVPQQGGSQQWVPQQGGSQQWVPQQGGTPNLPPQQGGTPNLPPQQGGTPNLVPQQGALQLKVPVLHNQAKDAEPKTLSIKVED